MRKFKCEIEFDLPDSITKEDVEAFLFEHLACMTLEKGLKNGVSTFIEENLFHSDSFDVNRVSVLDN